jgi:hypothetical protein
MRNVSDKIVEKIQTRILCYITFSENFDVDEIMQENMVQPGRPQITINMVQPGRPQITINMVQPGRPQITINMVQPSRPQITIKYGTCTLHAG